MTKVSKQKLLESAVSGAPDIPRKAMALYDLAAYLDTNGREREAWPYYEKAIRLGLDDSTHAQALTYLGSTLYNLREWQKARLTFEKARGALQSLPKLPLCTVKGKPILSFVRCRLEELRTKKRR